MLKQLFSLRRLPTPRTRLPDPMPRMRWYS